jgi:REP element-mobilizing transposase RayT
MGRPARVFVEGGWYHVYNRVGRGEAVFRDDTQASVFVDILREVAARDGLTIFAWCLMSNHYHLAVRTAKVPLDRPIRSLQQRVTRAFNLRHRIFGPLWQGRYRAILIREQRYLDQLLAYIHLNPVTAGVVDDPADYSWSGHREILVRTENSVVDRDEVLRLFGRTRRTGRAAYVRRLNSAREEPWIGEDPGWLPWWLIGRPPVEEETDPEEAYQAKRARETASPDRRPPFDVEDFLSIGAEALGVTFDSLRARVRSEAVVEARELLAVLGAERYGLKVKDLAKAMNKSREGITRAISRGTRKRMEEADYLKRLDVLDVRIAQAGASSVGGG